MISNVAMIYLYTLDMKFPISAWEVDSNTFRVSAWGHNDNELDHVYIGQYADKYTAMELAEKIFMPAKSQETYNYANLQALRDLDE